MPEYLKPARIGQIAVLLIALGAIAFTFSPPIGHQSSGVKTAGSRKDMLDFSMPDLSGTEWSISTHRGRVVLVNFWATWCPPCREEIPGFIRLAKSVPELDIVGVAMDEGDNGVIRQFAQSAGINYPVLLPPPSSPFVSAIESLPISFLVDKQGKVAKVHSGMVSEATVREDFARLSTEP